MGTSIREHRTGRSATVRNFTAIDAHFRQAGPIGKRARTGKGRVKGDTNTRQNVRAALKRETFTNY